MKLPRMLLWLPLALLSACAAPQTETAQLPPPEECPFVYVAAPGNYIIDIASGAEVILDPGVQDFELFCDADMARSAVDRGVSSGDLPEGDWRIYRLDGQMEELGQALGGGRYALGRMAQIVDWVTEQPVIP